MITNIQTNTIFIGLITLIMNMGNKNLLFKLNKNQEKLLSEPWMKYTLIFAVFFMSTRNIVLAIGFSILFYLVMNHFLNDESHFCIIPEKFKEIADKLDTNKDGKISFDELSNIGSIFEKENSSNTKNHKDREGMGLKGTSSKIEEPYENRKIVQKDFTFVTNPNTINSTIEKISDTQSKDDLYLFYPELLYPVVINGRGVF